MELKSGVTPGREALVVDDPVLTRVLGRYESFKTSEGEPDFTPSDLISLALLAKSENSRLKFYKNYYERAFNAVASGLQVQGKEALVSAVRKFLLAARDLSADWQACFVLRQKLMQLADLPAAAVGLTPEHDAAELNPVTTGVIDWYVEQVNTAVAGVLRVDAAICSFLGWDPQRRVDFEQLMKRHNFPDRAHLKTFFRPTGLQDTYKAYEGVPTERP